MEYKIQGRLIILTAALCLALCPASAQKKTDRQEEDIVRLMKAKSLELIDRYDGTFRKTVDATFLHNGTYFICDTAIWNTDEKVINAWGNVQLIQDETVLTSEKMDYFIDDNLAEFRGTLVQLQDKDRNTLRTNYLDYNTKDSVAIFHQGASMRDKDGQVMESIDGTYKTREGLFTFNNDVDMFTDSIFVKTEEMQYNTKENRAIFTSYIDFWKDDNMLSASGGWYCRPDEIFFFKDNVHAISRDQEVWCDSMYFYRLPNNIEMRGSALVQDPTRDVAALADYMFYEDTTATITMKRNAAVAIMTEDKETSKRDTVYFGADSLVYNTIKRCDVPAGEVVAATARRKSIDVDAVAEYRAKAAKDAEEEAKKAKAEWEQKNNPNYHPATQTGGDMELDKPSKDKPLDKEEEKEEAPEDTVEEIVETAPQEPDTSKIGFVLGVGDVKIFRKDIQVRCDSLRYCDLDSIARFYIKPVIWNEGNRQYTSDSLFVLIKDRGADRANLMNNAFIITHERDRYYDQIKGMEVMAYFDSTSALKRFDALGGSQAIFYLEEDGEFATVNKVESKILTATMKKGSLDNVRYFESPKNDAYPTAQVEEADRFLTGFNWQPERRPASPRDVTPLTMRPSERLHYESLPHCIFKNTDRYFPGYMESVYKGIALRDSLRNAPQPVVPEEVEAVPDSVEFKELPAPALAKDTAAVTAPEVPEASDSLATEMLEEAADSLATEMLEEAADSVAAEPHVPTAKELKQAQREAAMAEKQAQREAVRAEKQAQREARWAELDARDAAKAAAKEQKAKEKQRRKALKAIEAQRRQELKEQKRYERYKARFEKRKAREDARAAAKSSSAPKVPDTPLPQFEDEPETPLKK